MTLHRIFTTFAALVLLSLSIAAQAQTLTAPQIAALRADILGDPVLSVLPNNQDSALAIAAAYNQTAVPDLFVWHPTARISAILDTFSLANFTPVDTISESDTDPVISRRMGRLLSIQVKQMNLQLMLQGRDFIDCTLPNVRASLRDALIQVPAGVNGAFVAVAGASGASALAACQRKATRGEKLFSTGTAITGSTTGSLMGYVGAITQAQVAQARAN